MLVYEKLLPGSQLMNRLQDMGYRLLHVSDPRTLRERAENDKPLVVLVDLDWRETDICAIIRDLRSHPATSHLPVLAFVDHRNQPLQDAARDAGATLVAGNEAILSHLPQLLDQALEVR
jgi:PleD family two-component response regulator